MKKLLFILGLLIVVASCKDSTPTSGNVTMKVSAASTSGKTIASGRVATSRIVLTDFKVNIGDIKFDVDNDDARFKTDSVVEDVKLKGPFLLNILDSTKTLSQLINTVNLHVGQYKEIKVKFVKSTVAGEMNGKTFLIKGTFDKKKFLISSEKEVVLKVKFEDHNKKYVATTNNQNLIIKIRIDALLAKLVAWANAGYLQDIDGDGFIDLCTCDKDGHKDLGDQIRSIIEGDTKMDDKD